MSPLSKVNSITLLSFDWIGSNIIWFLVVDFSMYFTEPSCSSVIQFFSFLSSIFKIFDKVILFIYSLCKDR